MEFTHDNKKYRVERGVGTGKWLLLAFKDEGPRGWRLIGDFPAAIDDVDIQDRAKAALIRGEANINE